ncbi:type II toxin-antitoxin system RelE/ParE family toxin [Bosea sp. (in: a-proteobacteria)]|jgi:toxin ParE1/3/4|uniref:type II toxin-antitoxin system RelE/ParE family toxin n=1 Tax=Bosea sp. (in: a-proteobacteria) TaxID=1871050 RepID=UPI002B4667D4|nr:type II toxin-antitoxin system RelE/ParE family toxin [Bosea sp. (in: a-proteobacteria)]WRH56828.1 MAG: type II toxin-antitoxin system RelE/ParE family toxin [Bosea sp. (in: a-proteobacteria)]
MKIVWTPRARRNLRDAARYVMQFSPTAALSMVQAIRAAPEQLIHFPSSGRPGQIEGTRELLVGSTDYILPYRVQNDVIEILAVIHTSRRWPDQL